MKYYKTLKVGQIVEVFIENENGEFVSEGKGVLIRRAETWEEPVPFPYRDEPVQINIIKEKWIVRYKDKFSTYERPRWVYKFHSQGSIPILDGEVPEEEFIQGFCIEVLEDPLKCELLKKQLKSKEPTDLTKQFYNYVNNL